MTATRLGVIAGIAAVIAEFLFVYGVGIAGVFPLIINPLYVFLVFYIVFAAISIRAIFVEKASVILLLGFTALMMLIAVPYLLFAWACYGRGQCL